jgi:hypothetical protein
MMNTTEFARGEVSLELPKGKMFLYQQPELLTKEDHGHLGMNPTDKPYQFAHGIMSVPLLAAEIFSAQKHYPVVFSGQDGAQPLAVLSINDQDNLFVDDQGNWEAYCYVPSYLRRYPFAFATSEDDKFAMVIDRASAAISDLPEHPFFEGDELSQHTQEMVDFCGQYEAERRRTDEFTAKLKELDLLSLQSATPQAEPESKPLASYYAVDGKKLESLSPEQLHELHSKGFLSFIFAHLFSMENWNRLLERSRISQQPG